MCHAQVHSASGECFKVEPAGYCMSHNRQKYPLPLRTINHYHTDILVTHLTSQASMATVAR